MWDGILVLPDGPHAALRFISLRLSKVLNVERVIELEEGLPE
jgi:hypothetical protein